MHLDPPSGEQAMVTFYRPTHEQSCRAYSRLNNTRHVGGMSTSERDLSFLSDPRLTLQDI